MVPRAAPPVVPGFQKSPGVAVLLSFLLLGGGFLYLNRVGAGVALLVWDLFLFFLILIPFIGWVAAPLLWLVSFAIVAPLTYSAANDYNRSLGNR
ncbi:hypothetical protein GCM10023201_33420 [Actinomycetospora corticicola]|uniref:TM2 domain-containing membrane protein YozV n=1 Tax=Actinomycetospora corticicola TaxID=663602 RepID=A0A7Y9DS71_9PSEU|nr:hypothetical protein [Actinomycetospora corticicola]NYD34535.1 TM2 domain-containing membrane protein YozV [Actinomycetospora corticicola]